MREHSLFILSIMTNSFHKIICDSISHEEDTLLFTNTDDKQ